MAKNERYSGKEKQPRNKGDRWLYLGIYHHGKKHSSWTRPTCNRMSALGEASPSALSLPIW